VGAAAVAGLGAIMSGQKQSDGDVVSKAKKQEKKVIVDVSIPYDAAAVLAYNEWKGNLAYDAETYQKFKKLYEDLSVLQVCRKRTLREIDEATQKSEIELANLLKELAEKAAFSFQETKK
jgi:hypothetical protein